MKGWKSFPSPSSLADFAPQPAIAVIGISQTLCLQTPGLILTDPSVLQQFELMAIAPHYCVDGLLDIICLISRINSSFCI